MVYAHFFQCRDQDFLLSVGFDCVVVRNLALVIRIMKVNSVSERKSPEVIKNAHYRKLEMADIVYLKTL